MEKYKDIKIYDNETNNEADEEKKSNTFLDIILFLVVLFVLYVGGWFLVGRVDSETHGEWYHGIFHGFYYEANLLYRLYDHDALLKAETYTQMYDRMYWMFYDLDNIGSIVIVGLFILSVVILSMFLISDHIKREIRLKLYKIKVRNRNKKLNNKNNNEKGTVI